jgi:L-amino acid N-acyltransferase YncA
VTTSPPDRVGAPARVSIRGAAVEDWAAIYPLVQEVVAEGTTYAMPEGISSAEGRTMWMEWPPGRTVVAEESGRVVGVAKMGPNRQGRGAHVATASFLVASGARGKGVGLALGRHVVDWARANGYRGIQFNAVVATNAAALRLWRGLGFRIVGSVPGAFRHPTEGFVDLLVMYLDLSDL